MADNTELSAGSGGDIIATDDIAGVKYQRVKVTHGADGSATDVSSASPLPVTANLSAVDNAVLDAIETATEATQAAVEGTLTVDGSGVTQPVSAAALPLPSGAATEAKQDTSITSLQAIETAVEGTLTVGLPSGASTAANQTTIIGHVDGIEASLTSILAALSPTLSYFKSIDLDESEEEVKDTAGSVHAVTAFNLTAAPLFLKFYDVDADNVEVGTTVPDFTLVVPGNADSDGAGFVLPLPKPLPFSTAITVACTTGVADNDNGAPGSNACVVLIAYV